MSLIDLWRSSPDQIRDKSVQQLIGFAGGGKLSDGTPSSAEFREFIRTIPSEMINRYVNECLSESFKESGFVLQDLVNEVGSRLGFQIQHGRYRGKSGAIGFDGLWSEPQIGHIVVEVKTTDAYRIDLNTIAGYRNRLIRDGEFDEDKSSIIIVVGRQDTGDLEAQIRGSKHAWDVRLISADSLLRLLSIKEEVEDPNIGNQIRSILIPHEYTRLDEIINLVFSTTEDVLTDDRAADPAESRSDKAGGARKDKPVSFNDACAERIGRHLNMVFLKRSRATFATSDEAGSLVCAVSKTYDDPHGTGYWFAFHPHQKVALETVKTAYVGFGCGSPGQIILFPFQIFAEHLDDMNTTTRADGSFYWHVQIRREPNRWLLLLRKEVENPDISQFALDNA